MGDKSKIEWTDASWTPIRARNIKTRRVGWHCEHVSPGCEHCYSETMNMGMRGIGTGLPFKPGHRKDVEIFLDEQMLWKPLQWRRPRMVFVCSMTDLFADFVEDSWLHKVFAVMAACPQHTFQVLTKRAHRMSDYLNNELNSSFIQAAALAKIPARLWEVDATWNMPWPLPNVWVGVSTEDGPRAKERIPHLLAAPAALRFVSYEPALGPISFRFGDDLWYQGGELPELLQVNPVDRASLNALAGFTTWPSCHYMSPTIPSQHRIIDGLLFESRGEKRKIDWIIYGGESGPGRRPSDINWAVDTMAQCKAEGTKFFFKQDGAHRSGQRGRASDELWACKEFPDRYVPPAMAEPPEPEAPAPEPDPQQELL